MKDAVLKRAREVFDIEIEGLTALRDHLDDRFVTLVERCSAAIDAGGKLIVTGVGKSGHIGRKIAATLSSVGTPSVFMHPVEARHGDLGLIQENDLMLAISYSGETEELLVVLPPAKRLGVDIIGITGNAKSALGAVCDFVYEMRVPREACPFNLAPTTTTTALLALGDALALVLLEQRGFTRSDYGRRHPGGAIGRLVTMTAGDIMRSLEHTALVSPNRTVRETIYQMGHARCGSAIIVDEQRKLLGIFTDGDFRRWAEKDPEILKKTVSDVMTPHPVAVPREMLAAEVLKVLEKRHIDDLVVVDGENTVQGFIDVQDLPALKIM